MSLEEKEQRIKEQRNLQALQKNLVGSGGKPRIILKVLGQRIIHHTNLDAEDRYDLEPGNSEAIFNQIPIVNVGNMPLSEESNEEYFVGEADIRYTNNWFFCGLSRGMHLEIKYKEDEDATMEVWYRGYLVLQEVMGELTCYVPSPEWEGMIDRLYKIAQPIWASRKDVASAIDKQKKKWRINEFLQDMKTRWGF